MAPRDLIQRTRLFALAVFKFCRKLPNRDEIQETAALLRRAANATRSNYRAARKGRSRAEFQSKLQIAFEEADECEDCLEFRRDANIAHAPGTPAGSARGRIDTRQGRPDGAQEY
jgi:four helix bundle protein